MLTSAPETDDDQYDIRLPTPPPGVLADTLAICRTKAQDPDFDFRVSSESFEQLVTEARHYMERTSDFAGSLVQSMPTFLRTAVSSISSSVRNQTTYLQWAEHSRETMKKIQASADVLRGRPRHSKTEIERAGTDLYQSLAVLHNAFLSYRQDDGTIPEIFPIVAELIEFDIIESSGTKMQREAFDQLQERLSAIMEQYLPEIVRRDTSAIPASTAIVTVLIVSCQASQIG